MTCDPLSRLFQNAVLIPKEYTLFDQREQQLTHSSYRIEQEMMACFRTGDRDRFYQLLSQECAEGQVFVSGTLSDSRLRTLQYIMVTLGTLISRTCIREGMEVSEAFNRNDAFLREVDGAADFEALMAATRHIDGFLARMAEINRSRSLNRYVLRCRDYIRAHLNEPVTREELSAVCGLSAGYLSDVFAKEAGCSIPEYVLREKLSAAQRLLREDRLTLSQIGYSLGFCSQSYFTACFKRAYDCTPGQYRRMNRQQAGA